MTELDPGRVYMADCRALQYCAAGVRRWCKRYGVDYLEMVRTGIPFAVFERIGDTLGLTAVEFVKNGRR